MRIFFWAAAALAVYYLFYYLIVAVLAFTGPTLSIPLGSLLFVLGFVGYPIYCILLAFGSPLPVAYAFYRFRASTPKRTIWAWAIASGLVIIFAQIQIFFPNRQVEEVGWQSVDSVEYAREGTRVLVYWLLALPLMFCISSP